MCGKWVAWGRQKKKKQTTTEVMQIIPIEYRQYTTNQSKNHTPFSTDIASILFLH